jgi:hypothetical protein
LWASVTARIGPVGDAVGTHALCELHCRRGGRSGAAWCGRGAAAAGRGEQGQHDGRGRREEREACASRTACVLRS